MPELHITSSLIAGGAAPAPAAPGAPVAADAGAFAALLAGQLDPALGVAAATREAREEDESAEAPAQDAQASHQGDVTAQLLAALGMPQEPPKDPALAAAAAATGKAADAALPVDVKSPRGRTDAAPGRVASEAPLGATEPPVGALTEKAVEPLQSLQPFEAVLSREAAGTAAPQAGVTAVAAPAETQPAHAARHSAALPGPVGTPQWREALGTSVTLLATQRVQSAELRVQPPELGPLQISIRIEANEASVLLAAPHPETRQAIEDALPRLREMLEAGGLAVGHASVGDSGGFERETREHRHGTAAEPAAGAAAAAPRAPVRSNQLVDVFA